MFNWLFIKPHSDVGSSRLRKGLFRDTEPGISTTALLTVKPVKGEMGFNAGLSLW